MFERATIFSTIFIFIFFAILGYKYFDFVEAKNQSAISEVKNCIALAFDSINFSKSVINLTFRRKI
jgi:hypothetical protein